MIRETLNLTPSRQELSRAMQNVLVTDSTFDRLDIEQAILEPLGCSIDSRQCKTPAQLIEIVPQADFVITQFAPLNSEVIDAMGRARLIVRYGVGVDNVDLEAARRRGIPVCNVPDYCVDEVADHTLALILALTRQVVSHCLHVRTALWGLATPLSTMRTLRDLSVGVVGCGRIGRAVIERVVPFKCNVQVFDPVVQPAQIEELGACRAGSLEALLECCDVLTLHCPSNSQTRRMVDARALARLKSGAVLVNVSRGDVVVTDALVAALRSERLAAAALDVCDPEPIPPGHPLLNMPNVVLTPHIASTSPQAARRLRKSAATAIARALSGEPLGNVVNGVEHPRVVR